MIHRGNEAQGKTNRRVAMFNGKRLSGWMALAVFATVGGAMVATDPAFAKTDVDKLTIGGEIRERYEVRTNSSFNAGGTLGAGSATAKAGKGNESVGSQRVRVNVGYDLTPDVAFFAQISDARYFGTEGAATGSGAAAVSTQNNNSNGVDLHQGYIQLKNVLVPGLSLKAGRQEIIFGDHRLFGNFGWSQIGNSFDGVRMTHSTQSADLDLFWARIADQFATAASAAGQPAILFPGASANGGPQATGNQDIYGAYLTLKPAKNWTVEPYYFLLQDARSTQVNGAAASTVTGLGATQTAFSSILTAQAPAQTRNFLGGRVNGKANAAGTTLDVTYEGNYQFGSIASQCQRATNAANCGNIDGTGLATPLSQVNGNRGAHINASQHAFRTGLTFDSVPMKPRLGFEFDYASGDKCANGSTAADPNDCQSGKNKHFNTADNLYPTNHFHYGYMDLMSWKNMVNYAIKFDVKPSPVSKLQFDYNIMRLANTADNWYRAGQVAYFTSKVTNQAASLGQELDVHYWHTFKEKFKFELGVGHFFAGEYLQKSTSNNQQGLGAFGGTQGSASNGFGGQTRIVDQNWGYVMGSILF